MSRERAKASGTALGVLTALLLSGGAAQASVISSPLESLTPRSASDERLASPVLGCWDPQSWVWSGPRAERVSVVVSAEGPCEIGSDGCARQPESVPPEVSAATPYEVAALTCALKQAQHEQHLSVEPFDAKSCYESEMTLWSADEVDPARRPFEGLSCTEQDPECRSMPPNPQPIELSSAPSAAALVVPVTLSPDRHEGARLDSLGTPLEGVHRRVDRPPND